AHCGRGPRRVRSGTEPVPHPTEPDAPRARPALPQCTLCNSMLALFLGNHLVVLPRFDALHTLECLAQYRIDFVVLVPTMMQRIWRLGDAVRTQFDLSALRLMVHMAAPCPAWLKEAWIAWLGPERVHELYGGTE